MKKTVISKSRLYTSLKDSVSLNSYSAKSLKGKEIIICKSEYHNDITDSMVYDIVNNLSSKQKKSLAIINVPGTFELPFCIKLVLDKFAKKKSINPLIIIAVGCVIKGETKHDEYISSTVINAIRNLSLEYKTPILNGILTTFNKRQAIDRAGIKFSKGSDLADALNSLVNIIDKIGSSK
tara:strand:+ start:192 stop:731 length:540 start_codon:yes stop_codon:yes gene_type:complete